MSQGVDDTVTVLGAGIVGICCALALAETGKSVRLVDAAKPGQGASFGNAGVVSPWSILPQSLPGIWRNVPAWLLREDGPVSIKPGYIPKLLPWALRFFKAGQIDRVQAISAALSELNHDNVSLYRQLLNDTGKSDLLKDSFYVHAFRDSSQAKLDSLEYDLRREAGAELKRIEQAELKDLEPALSDEFKAAILIKGQARVSSPAAISAALIEKFVRAGGELIQAKANAISPDARGNWTLHLDEKEITSSTLVLCLGAWSAQLLKPLGIHVPLEAERGYHVQFKDAPIHLTHSVMDMDLKLVASSMADGLRIAGTAEFTGLDKPPTDKRIASLTAIARKMLPALSSIEPSVWMGTRPSMPDGLPCIGNVKNLPGLMVAFGHGHMGLMMAPKTGKLICDLVTGVEINMDLKPFHLDRF